MPKGYETGKFSFLVPADAVGPLTLTAELNYWPFSQKLADYLLGKDKLKVEIRWPKSRRTSLSPMLRPADSGAISNDLL
ncbi:hypothetical protein [Pseudomonas sp. BIC9C]|uniref:hypothetical protein n=1 Tax=Pseudomonas sp. BIC9C TaxID=3078458 RepID=UPI002AD26232|nr:hypothetical protein [Pseudomonas sp. BIC9C]